MSACIKITMNKKMGLIKIRAPRRFGTIIKLIRKAKRLAKTRIDE